MPRVIEYRVERAYTLVRHVLKELFSAREIAKIKKDGAVMLDETPVRASDALKKGDVVKIYLPTANTEITGENADISVLYEDDDLIVIDKPQGVCSIPTGKKNVLAGLIFLYGGGEFHVLTRLDKDTRGLVLVARSAYATEQMRRVKIEKEYLAVVDGRIDEPLTIDLPILKTDGIKRQVHADGKPSLTLVSPLSYDEKEDKTTVKCRLMTGRTHQIRVHLASIHHPVSGDSLYGNGTGEFNGGQRLVCHKIAFTSPFTGKKIEVISGYTP